MGRPAAFFDLDRTLIARSSALALARPFRERGLIGPSQLARAAFWQLVFSAHGGSPGTVRRMAGGGLAALRGLAPETLAALVAEAMDPVLKPLVYREALALARSHQALGEPVYVLTAALEEIARPLADELGFDGAVGTVCEVVGGVYTGRILRACHGAAKAEALRELAAAEGLDLARSTAYSDGASDVPFLEAVGNPVAVNPDRELRRVAGERGWSVLAFREPVVPRARRLVPAAAYGIPFALGAGAAVWAARRRAA